ncbi:MAG: hypothetical protein A3D31_18465 [Candidatus Fluviicola riflensis]|nr:MAG: hypothetical protein CHH17_03695 [Candidatus Fluviicola riflensis]OGS76433.1 MAG: hypothetical protein A3D31_18465 [Candidatus Fluviicola riflensis]OGS82727.1 MAG: hypothetical protein A2724_13290 [Fluviicola sp. RIFCSPHIGHO2_01_FULL_43_53]OGS89026.1 MAG: hypothetical protein A3E30_16950 [Fluviicola sp. RIFCSPHIGHO2_12_FULL_43_24]
MKKLILFTVLLALFTYSCKKDEKKDRTITFDYQLADMDHFDVSVKKNGDIMYGYSDEKYTAYPQGDGTYLMGSTEFKAKKGDQIAVYVVDNFGSNEPVSFTLKVNGSTVSTTDVNSMESAISISYTVE